MLSIGTLDSNPTILNDRTKSHSNVVDTERAEQSLQNRILVVDDEAYNLLAMTSMFKALRDYEGLEQIVDTASSGEQCLELVKNGLLSASYQYSLVFMDLSMRPMDGYQTTERLRELYRGR